MRWNHPSSDSNWEKKGEGGATNLRVLGAARQPNVVTRMNMEVIINMWALCFRNVKSVADKIALDQPISGIFFSNRHTFLERKSAVFPDGHNRYSQLQVLP